MGRHRFLLWVGLVLASLGAGLAAPRISTASLPGPSSISQGITDDPAFLDPSETESTRNAWFARALQINASWVRLGAYWQFIAPTKPKHPTDPSDPSYAWYWLDPAVRDAAAHGIKILMQIGYPPTWALGNNAPPTVIPHTWRPNVEAFGQFARAVATRYSGHFPDPLRPGHYLPRVTYFQAWNEPNISDNLAPQWTRNRHGRPVPYSPYLYRRLLNAAYFNVKAIQPHAKVLFAGLGPYGDPPGVDRNRPVLFLREALCLRGDQLRRESCPDPPHFNAIDVHPYTRNPTHHASNPYDVSVPDLRRLTHVVAVAVRKHTVRPAGRKPLWITEIAWNSRPPVPYGVPLLTQARYLSRAFYEFWRRGVSHIFWFLIHDGSLVNATGAGLYFQNGTPKPSVTAFRFPFVALRDRHGIVTVWGHAPIAGMVSIEHRTGRGWRTLFRLRTTRGGIAYARRRLAPHLLLRGQIGNVASIPWGGA